ncbi:MAG: hypothetical protein HYX59_12785 [Elusimicrobia bacterium]|nr:hypothetical protein [Elusimicrobiota bacterium]
MSSSGPQNASTVIRWFESPAPPCGTNYVKDGIPSEWKPHLIFAEPISEIEYHKHFTSHITIRLDHFNLAEASQGSIESARDIGKKLIAWMAQIPGVQIWDLAAGFASQDGVNADVVGHWMFRYRVKESWGVYNVWILPRGTESALLIAAIDERYESRAITA